MYTLKSSDVPSGYYTLDAHLIGLWSETAKTGRLFECFFQSQTDYDKKSGSQTWGIDGTERQSWNGVNLNVNGDWFSSTDSLMYLVCSTSGTVKNVQLEVTVTSAMLAGKLP
jgi:hypothetical protein